MRSPRTMFPPISLTNTLHPQPEPDTVPHFGLWYLGVTVRQGPLFETCESVLEAAGHNLRLVSRSMSRRFMVAAGPNQEPSPDG